MRVRLDDGDGAGARDHRPPADGRRSASCAPTPRAGCAPPAPTPTSSSPCARDRSASDTAPNAACPAPPASGRRVLRRAQPLAAVLQRTLPQRRPGRLGQRETTACAAESPPDAGDAPPPPAPPATH
ncbi:MAG: hypothetical protein MZW92_59840 [Comamonadaceae bacterium]|nr:hypothetical protein [Comamonadaceae bacterium]